MWKNFGGLWFSPVLNMHALILQFIFSLCIAFLCSTISVLIMPFRAQLVISNWIYINHYGCFWFSLTKVIHMLAYSFFAPSIYIWIICHRRACVDTILVKLLSCVWLFEIPWTVAYQAPPSMEFSRQEYWSALPFPSPVFLPKMLNLNPIMRWDTFRELRKIWGKICEITGLNSCKYQRHEGTVLLLLLSCFSRVRLFATPWTIANQAPPSMEFSRQEYWSGLPFPAPKW